MTTTALTEIPKDALQTPPADIESVKAFHRAFPTGVTIVTSRNESGEPVGLVVNAFSSVSMEPPMVLVCINQSSQSHSAFVSGQHVGVSVLANDQADQAMHFAKSGGDKFATVNWEAAPNGSPHISGAAATLEMEIVQLVSAGTHTVFFGLVTTAATSGKAPLIYHDAKFYDGGQVASV